MAMFSAKLIAENGNPEWACNELIQMDRLIPDKYFIKFFLGLSRLSANEPLEAFKYLERALALEPKLLLLDEPLAGLSHMEAVRAADAIAGLVADGLTVILIEHNLGEVMRVCSRMVVIDNGTKIAHGDPEKVMADHRVRAAYLGS